MTRTSFIKRIRKVYPKEGTRVRIPGVYHITTWYGAVGHWGAWERGAIDGDAGRESMVGRVRAGSERRAG